jgi:hypothetical protein
MPTLQSTVEKRILFSERSLGPSRKAIAYESTNAGAFIATVPVDSSLVTGCGSPVLPTSAGLENPFDL